MFLVQPIPGSYQGQTHDQDKKYLGQARVTSFRRIPGSGRYAALQSVGQATTDDQGRFRIAQLVAGSYRVCVVPPVDARQSFRGTAYERLCYPERSQDRIPLKTGETRKLHFDFKPIPGLRVSGHLSNATSVPFFSLSRETADGLVPLEDDHDEWNPTTSRFGFPAVIPGEYRLTVQTMATPAMEVSKRIVVGPAEPGDLDLTLAPLHEIEGVIKSDDGSALPAGLAVSFRSGPVIKQVDRPGAFKLVISGLQAWEVHIDALPWQVQSIKQAGRDITERLLEPLADGSWGKLEIVLSRSHGSIQGTLRTTTDQRYSVLALQARSRGPRFVESSQCKGPDAKFEFASLSPGEYQLLASKLDADIPFLEPSYLASHASFVATVHVDDGQVSKVEVTPVPDGEDPGR